MRNGIIYQVVNWLFEQIKFINLVELFKWVTKKIFPNDTLLASRLGVDVFIILKWAFVIFLWQFQFNSILVNIIVWYLIASNLYTYFYYHSWTKDLENGNFNLDRIKRRFLNLMIAIAFNIFCFAYLFAIPFSTNFKWVEGVSNTSDSILFSLANSLTVEFPPINVITELGNTLTLLETFTSFIFLTIILSNSIPQIKD